MVFKLVRTDSEEPCKIQLPIGTHLIGRGKFLDCDDKRVSRKHGELEVTCDGMSIKALHCNPCFYMKKGTKETQILKLNCSVELSHGDKFGMLPNSYWYELLHCSDLDVGRSPDRMEDNTEPMEFQLESVAESNNNDKEQSTCDMNETVTAPQRSESPSLIPPVATLVSPAPKSTETSTVRIPNSLSNSQTTDDQSPTQVLPPSDTNRSPSPPKRCHSPVDSKDEVKKIKLEPADAVVKQEPDVRPGPSGDQGGHAQANTNNLGRPPSPAKPAPPGRERCHYGASCYRRNPQHKAQFAHPQDPDWGAGDRGACPYGSGCRKRDPRHWQTHTHPPATAPPPPPAQKKKRSPKRKNSDSENSEDETPETSLIVTGKRARKTVQRPSYSGSDLDDDEDPFGTDEEDEWVPGSQSQYSQDSQID